MTTCYYTAQLALDPEGTVQGEKYFKIMGTVEAPSLKNATDWGNLAELVTDSLAGEHSEAIKGYLCNNFWVRWVDPNSLKVKKREFINISQDPDSPCWGLKYADEGESAVSDNQHQALVDLASNFVSGKPAIAQSKYDLDGRTAESSGMSENEHTALRPVGEYFLRGQKVQAELLGVRGKHIEFALPDNLDIKFRAPHTPGNALTVHAYGDQAQGKLYNLEIALGELSEQESVLVYIKEPDPLHLLADLQSDQTLPSPLVEMLSCAVKGRVNILIAGNNDTDKQGFLHALVGEVPVSEHVLVVHHGDDTVNDISGIRPDSTWGSFDLAGTSNLTLQGYFKHITPARLVFTAVGKTETADYLELAYENDGVMGTITADSARDAIHSLEIYARLNPGADTSKLDATDIRHLIAGSVHLLVFLEVIDGKTSVSEILALVNDRGLDPNKIHTVSLAYYSHEDNCLNYRAMGFSGVKNIPWKAAPRLRAGGWNGWDQDEAQAEPADADNSVSSVIWEDREQDDEGDETCD